MEIRIVCLGILAFGDASGYDIKRQFEQTYRHFIAAGCGSIYPALARLRREGLVRMREQPTHVSRRHRKVYSLTPLGHQALLQALAQAKPQHRVHSDYALLIFFAHLLAPERAATILNERLDNIRAQIRRLEDYAPTAGTLPPGVEFTRQWGLATLKASANFIAANQAAFLEALKPDPQGQLHPAPPHAFGDPA